MVKRVDQLLRDRSFRANLIAQLLNGGDVPDNPPPVPGVYLLFHKQELVYIGRSEDCYRRILAHRTNGRAFDFFVVAPVRLLDAPWLERTLVSTLTPRQNRQLRPTDGAEAACPTTDSRPQARTSDIQVAALTFPAACEYTGLSRTRLYQLAADGVLHPRHAGRHRIILRAELDAYLASLPPAPIRVRQTAETAGMRDSDGNG